MLTARINGSACGRGAAARKAKVSTARRAVVVAFKADEKRDASIEKQARKTVDKVRAEQQGSCIVTKWVAKTPHCHFVQQRHFRFTRTSRGFHSCRHTGPGVVPLLAPLYLSREIIICIFRMSGQQTEENSPGVPCPCTHSRPPFMCLLCRFCSATSTSSVTR